MASISDYRFEPLESTNIHHLVDLYRNVFGQNYSLEYIRKKYLSQYTGIAAQGHFAFYKNEAIAFHGAIPSLIKSGNLLELSAQYGDAMTMKLHTGRGLFTHLGNLTDDLLKSSGVHFVWGFPNQNSEYAYLNKLNWQGSKRMKCFIFKTNTFPIESITRKSNLFTNRYKERVLKIINPIQIKKEHLNSIDTTEYAGVDRSREFYHYKSFTTNFFVQLTHSKAWIKPQGGLLIGDFQIEPKSSIKSVVKEFNELAKKLGLTKVVIQASPDSVAYLLLSIHYKPIESWLIGYKNFNSRISLEKLQFTLGDLDTF